MVLLPFKKRTFVRRYAVLAPTHKSETKLVEEIGKKPKKLEIVSTVGTVLRKFFSVNPMGECREVLHGELPMKKRIIIGGRNPVLEEHNRNLKENKRVSTWKDQNHEGRRQKKPRIMEEEAIVDQEGLNPPPEADLPAQFRNRIREMNGTEPKLLIHKPLTESDLRKHYSRFAIPKGKLKTANFLTEEEHDRVDKIKGGSVEVTLLDPALREYKLNFVRWKMSNSFTYNLTSGWIDVLENNKDLKENDWVQLWCFQRDSKSYLALVHLRLGRGEGTRSRCGGNTTSSQVKIV